MDALKKVRDKQGDKDLIFASADKNKEVLEKCTEFHADLQMLNPVRLFVLNHNNPQKIYMWQALFKD